MHRKWELVAYAMQKNAIMQEHAQRLISVSQILFFLLVFVTNNWNFYSFKGKAEGSQNGKQKIYDGDDNEEDEFEDDSDEDSEWEDWLSVWTMKMNVIFTFEVVFLSLLRWTGNVIFVTWLTCLDYELRCYVA